MFVNVEVVHTARRICLILSGVSRAAVSQMALSIIELFGYDAADVSRVAADARAGRRCPFIQSSCTKMFNDGQLSGVCTIKPSTSEPVICCPNRLYADEYAVLRDVANSAFGRELRLVSATQLLDLGQEAAMGSHRTLAFGGEFTTTVDQIVNAFSSPTNLPPAQAYEQAIRRELGL